MISLPTPPPFLPVSHIYTTHFQYLCSNCQVNRIILVSFSIKTGINSINWKLILNHWRLVRFLLWKNFNWFEWNKSFEYFRSEATLHISAFKDKMQQMPGVRCYATAKNSIQHQLYRRAINKASITSLIKILPLSTPCYCPSLR